MLLGEDITSEDEESTKGDGIALFRVGVMHLLRDSPLDVFNDIHFGIGDDLAGL
jgi:hypothetical protein